MKFRTVTLTDRRPISFDEEKWLVIAESAMEYPAIDKPARKSLRREASLKVRQCADGRCIVYGTSRELRFVPVEECGLEERGKHSNGAYGEPVRRGYYVYGLSNDESGEDSNGSLAHARPTDAAIVTAIRQVADELEAPELAHACIAALPAETV